MSMKSINRPAPRRWCLHISKGFGKRTVPMSRRWQPRRRAHLEGPLMALATFADLKASIASWLNRTDLTATIPDFVRLAEADLSREIRIPTMQLEATGALVAGDFTLPADFVEAKRLVIGDQEVGYITTEEIPRLTRNGYSDVRYYTRVGLQVRVLNGGTSAYSLLYWAKFAALNLDADTNWLLTNE